MAPLKCVSAAILLMTAVGTSVGMIMPKIKLFEFHNGNLALLDAPANTDVVLVESDNTTERYILLQCRAPYPVQWIYSGDGIPEFVTNTSVHWDTDPTEFTASAGLFKLSEHHTGTYTCRSTQSSKMALFYYLFITGDSLLTAPGGDTVTFKPTDASVRIPCSVTHPKARVTLQKVVEGNIKCPVNDSISFNMKTGFTLAITESYHPEGEYICIANHKGKYTVAEYRIMNSENVVPESAVQDYPIGGGVGPHSRPGSGSSYNPGMHYPSPSPSAPPTPSALSKAKCSSFPCGRNAICRLNEAGEPSCRCQRNHHGDPYVKCFPECSKDTDCHPTKACRDNGCYDPCPGACDSSLQTLKSCKVLNHTVHCSYNHCNPSPCGPYSKCEDWQGGAAVCSCLSGYFGSPPHCSEYPVAPTSGASSSGPSRPPARPHVGPSSGASDEEQHLSQISPAADHHDRFPGQVDFIDVCRSNQECPPTLQCTDQRCTDPCKPNPCGRNTLCHVTKHEPVCSCAPGFIKVNQYCLPTNCRSQDDCPDNKACSRNRCVNPCAGYCGKNTDCVVEHHAPRCSCAPGFSGNPFRVKGCSRNTILTGASAASVDPEAPPSSVGSASLGGPGLPIPGIRPPVANLDLCGPTRTKCGKNAKCIHNSTCECEDGYSGDPHRFCYLIISIPDSAFENEPDHGFDEEEALNLRGPSSGAPGAPAGSAAPSIGKYPSITGSIPSTFIKDSSTKPPSPIVLITKDSCTTDVHCPSDKVCQGNACIDPCVFSSTCGQNQECLVIAHKTNCQCKLGYPIKINNNCYSRDNYTTFSRCDPNPCGPHSDCVGTDRGIQCKCKPNTVGSPPECRLKCTESFECPELLACSQGMCQDPCVNACGKLARCRVYHQTAKCFCPRGFQGNPRVACIPPKPNSRLAGAESLIELFDKSDPGSSYTDDQDFDSNETFGTQTESISGFDDSNDDLNDTSLMVEKIQPSDETKPEDSDLEKIYDEYVLKITNNDFVLESAKGGKNKKKEQDGGPRSELVGSNCADDDSCQQEEEVTTVLPLVADESVTDVVVNGEDVEHQVVLAPKISIKPLGLVSGLKKVESMERSLEIERHYDDYADDSSEMA